MVRGLSIPQAGILCLVAIVVGLVMGVTIGEGELPGLGPDRVSVAPDRTSATLTADSLPAGAVVVTYGPDDASGAVRTARVDREGDLVVTLSGLEPATTYDYRATHVAPNGSISLLGTGSFTTEPATGGDAVGPADNISATSDTDDAGAASDGDRDTGWDPGQEDTGQEGDRVSSYLTFDYDQSQDIVGFGVLAGSRSGNGTMEFLLLVDGEEFGPYTVQSGENVQYYSLETVGERFQIGVLETTGDVTVREFELRTTAEQE